MNTRKIVAVGWVRNISRGPSRNRTSTARLHPQPGQAKPMLRNGHEKPIVFESRKPSAPALVVAPLTIPKVLKLVGSPPPALIPLSSPISVLMIVTNHMLSRNSPVLSWRGHVRTNHLVEQQPPLFEPQQVSLT